MDTMDVGCLGHLPVGLVLERSFKFGNSAQTIGLVMSNDIKARAA